MSDLPPAKKSLGQHWLTNQAALKTICDAGAIKPNDTVLEIGPGTGTLTALLVQQAREVIAVEFDKTLAHELPKRVLATNLKVLMQDILKFDFSSLPADYKVVANIPYYLTSNLIRILSETPNQANRVVLLVQKEVAQRVAATPGAMSLLSVSAQYYWEVLLGLEIPANMFTPTPKVDSQLLILERRNQSLFTGVDEKMFFRLVKAGFAARRKTLVNSLSGGLRVGKEQIQTLLAEVYISPTTRAQSLSLEQWHMLYAAARSAGIL